MVPCEVIEESVSIPGAEGALEGILAYPDDVPPARAVLLLSPHPHMGGRMDNNVIEHLARRFAEEGNASLRFNYRGVGRSALACGKDRTAYEYWTQLEADRNYKVVVPDARSARAFLVNAMPPQTPVIYVGYSFGSCMAILLAGADQPERLVAISPPVSRVDLEGLDLVDAPLCFVTGDKDFVYDGDRFAAARATVSAPVEHVELEGADHFFRKEEERLYQAIRPFIFAPPPRR